MGKIPPKPDGRRRYPEGVFSGRSFGVEDTDSSQIKNRDPNVEEIKTWNRLQAKIFPSRRK